MIEDQPPYRGRLDDHDLEAMAVRGLAEPATKADLIAAISALRGDIEALKERLVTWLCAVLIALIAGIALLVLYAHHTTGGHP